MPSDPNTFPIAGLQAEVEKGDRLWVVCMARSDGISLFARTLELNHFDPCDKAKNDEFQLGLIYFPEGTRILWYLITVPIRYREFVERLAKDCHFTIQQDVIPVALTATGMQPFPVHGPNVIALQGNLDRDQAFKTWEAGQLASIEFKWRMGELKKE